MPVHRCLWASSGCTYENEHKGTMCRHATSCSFLPASDEVVIQAFQSISAKVYFCPECPLSGRRFVSSKDSDISRHRNLHYKEQIDPFVCDKCTYKTWNKSNLTRRA